MDPFAHVISNQQKHFTLITKSPENRRRHWNAPAEFPVGDGRLAPAPSSSAMSTTDMRRAEVRRRGSTSAITESRNLVCLRGTPSPDPAPAPAHPLSSTVPLLMRCLLMCSEPRHSPLLSIGTLFLGWISAQFHLRSFSGTGYASMARASHPRPGTER